MIQLPKSILGIIAAVFVLFLISPRFYQSIPAGHVGVATLFGEVQPKHFTEGLKIPVNPLYQWALYTTCARRPTPKPPTSPARTSYRPRSTSASSTASSPAETPSILKETGNISDVLAVHIVPKLRSLDPRAGQDHQTRRGLLFGGDSDARCRSPYSKD